MIAKHTSSSLILGYVLIFLASWVYASYCVLTRALKGIPSSVILFWYGIVGLTLASIAVVTDYAINDYGTGNGLRLFQYHGEVYALIVMGLLFDTLGVVSETIAFLSDSAGFVSLLSYIKLIYAFLADGLLFDEKFSCVELVAASIVLIVTVFTSIVKLHESKKIKEEDDDEERYRSGNEVK